MAFVKKTWLARIGAGLNKFRLGAGGEKVELINEPDSISQQGDALSATNLNDLETRIDNAFTSINTYTYIIDSQAKFNNWVNNISGNDYTYILFKYSPTLSLNKYIPSSTKIINMNGCSISGSYYLTSNGSSVPLVFNYYGSTSKFENVYYIPNTTTSLLTNNSSHFEFMKHGYSATQNAAVASVIKIPLGNYGSSDFISNMVRKNLIIELGSIDYNNYSGSKGRITFTANFEDAPFVFTSPTYNTDWYNHQDVAGLLGNVLNSKPNDKLANAAITSTYFDILWDGYWDMCACMYMAIGWGI